MYGMNTLSTRETATAAAAEFTFRRKLGGSGAWIGPIFGGILIA
jgi:hypothetical protein